MQVILTEKSKAELLIAIGCLVDMAENSKFASNVPAIEERIKCILIPEEISKVQLKDWEILYFKSSLEKFCKLDHRGIYSYDTHGGWTLDVMLKDSSNKTYSVKRLSDGEVFTIGKVYSYGKEGVLTKFSISAIGEMLCDIDYGNGRSYSNAPLRAIDVIKKEKDVFQWTTEVLQEFVQYCDRNWKGKVRFDEVAESFKQSKSTPKEWDEQTQVHFRHYLKGEYKGGTFGMTFPTHIFHEIKQAIIDTVNKHNGNQ